MSQRQLNRSIWLVELLKRYGRLTRAQINEHWVQSSLSDGREIPRRTFINLKNDVERTLDIEIACDTETYEYYIKEDEHNRNVTDWLVHTSALSEALTNSRQVANLIFLEDVPSARSFLNLVVEALKMKRVIVFDYAPYTRTKPSRGVLLEPYFLKLFKQRWYVTGRAVIDDTIKTYALDRMLSPTISSTSYEIPDHFDPENYFRDSFGIVFTHGEVKTIKLKVDSRQAKYFRALPLHPSQEELIHDTFSIFTYRMKISPDFVQELLSHGSKVTVLQPRELRLMVTGELQAALDRYNEC